MPPLNCFNPQCRLAIAADLANLCLGGRFRFSRITSDSFRWKHVSFFAIVVAVCGRSPHPRRASHICARETERAEEFERVEFL